MKEKKEKFEIPKVEIIELDENDVIVTSGGCGGLDDELAYKPENTNHGTINHGII